MTKKPEQINTGEFYRAFEDRHRGSRELIRSRLETYLPFILPLRQVHGEAHALDLGCGRGEWLELLHDNNFSAIGVDLDAGMLAACTKLGLNTLQTDAIQYLANQDDQSLSLVSGFHIAEHISFENLQTLVIEALRALKPGGLLILETPNPENIVVGSNSFYLDPTHIRPIPPLLLSFLTEHYAYERTKIVRLQEFDHLKNSDSIQLLDVLSGVSPDYAVIAQKQADKKILSEFDTAFDHEYGIQLNQAVQRYDSRVDQTFQSLERKATEIENQHQQLLNEINTTKEQLESIHQKTELSLEDAAEARLHALEAENKAEQIREQIMQDRMVADLKVQLHQAKSELREAQQSRQAQIDLVDQIKQELEQERQINHDHIKLSEQLKQKLEQIQQSNHHHWQLSEQLKQELEQIQQSNHHHWQLSEQLKQELEQVHQSNHHHWQLSEQLKQELEQVHQSNHHHWQLAEKHHQTIAALKNSLSWRITWPVRFGAGLLIHPLHTLRTTLNALLHGFIKTLNLPVAWAIKRVFSNKSRADRINHWLLVNYPHLHQQLYSVAQKHNIPTKNHSFTTASKKTNYESEHKNQVDENMQTKLDHLSPRARHIYHALQTAIAKHHQE